MNFKSLDANGLRTAYMALPELVTFHNGICVGLMGEKLGSREVFL